MTRHRPLLVSDDPELIDDVVRLAAAHGIEVHLAGDADGARTRWRSAPLIIVGRDRLEAVASARMPRRRDVVVVTRTPDERTWPGAVAIGAEHVVSLPDAERWLLDRIADSGEGPPRDGRVVVVVGSGGGAGSSTFAATLAVIAAGRSLRTLLVDADPTGGGLDVLLGMEDVGGVRWPDLVETRGRIAADTLAGALPSLQGVDLLSWGRSGPALIPDESLSAVLDAGRRGYDLVVVDLPRHLDAAGDLVLSRADHVLLVAANRVRSIAAAVRLVALLRPRCAALGLVLRAEPRGADDDAVLMAVDAPVIARLPTSTELALRADEGEPPSTRDAYARACAHVLQVVATGAAA